MKIINKTKLKIKSRKEWENLVPDNCYKVEILKIIKGYFGCGKGAVVKFYTKTQIEEFDAVWFFYLKELKGGKLR